LPGTRPSPGYVLKTARESLGMSFEELAAATSIPVVTLERMERGHAHTSYETVTTVQRFFERKGVSFVHEDGGGMSYLGLPDGTRRYVDGSELEPEERERKFGKGRVGRTVEERTVRTSWGYWIRPKDGDD